MHWCSRHLLSACHSKIHIHPRKHACATAQPLLCHGNHCDLSWNLSSVQHTTKIHASSWRSRGCVVHRHHLITHVGVGPIQLANGRARPCCSTRTRSITDSCFRPSFVGINWASSQNNHRNNCNTPQYIATHCITLQHTASHCITLQHAATSWLQHAAIYCDTLDCYLSLHRYLVIWAPLQNNQRNALQHTAT